MDMTTQTLFARGSVNDCGSRNLRRSDKHVPFNACDRWPGFQENQALGRARVEWRCIGRALAAMRALHHPTPALSRQCQTVYAPLANVHAHNIPALANVNLGEGSRSAAHLRPDVLQCFLCCSAALGKTTIAVNRHRRRE